MSPWDVSGNTGHVPSPVAACPCCNGSVYWVPRRLVNVLMRPFAPVRRYRCLSASCGGERNLHAKRLPLLTRRPG